MDRADSAGLGFAIAAHGALLAALSLGIGAATLRPIRGDPIEVSFTEDVGLTSSAPVISREAPAPSIAPELGPPEEAAPAPAPTPAAVPPPPARPSPTPAQKAAQPAPQPQPKQKNAAVGSRTKTSGSRFGSDFMKGLSDEPSTSRSQAPPAREVGAAVLSSLTAEIRRQLKPHWQRNVPTGADAEQLKTELTVSLARDGSVTGVEVRRTTGVTPSNRPQVALHQERARKAVTLAAPFQLPADLYDHWKEFNVSMDLRLAR